jgi:hypothetical protein
LKRFIIEALLVTLALAQIGTANYIWPGSGVGDDNHSHLGPPGDYPSRLNYPGNAEGHGEPPGSLTDLQPGNAEGHTGAPGQEEPLEE